MDLKILSCGAGMQSTALALISCAQAKGEIRYPAVPRYDAAIFCDLGIELEWDVDQVLFWERSCQEHGIPFYVLRSDLYLDSMERFGRGRVSAMPFWALDEEGKPRKISRRSCTVDYKILMIQKFVRYQLLGYRPHQHLRVEDVGAYELHIGFSFEEANRSFPSRHRMFRNCFPLIEMQRQRKDTYAYNLDVRGLDTKASACCPFHKNYFFRHLKLHYPKDCQNVVDFDDMLERMQPHSPIRNEVYLSRSRKRIRNLGPEDCADAQTFSYRGLQIWNGFWGAELKGGVPLEKPKICRYCGGMIRLVPASNIYGEAVAKRLGLEKERIYQCQNCNARVGCHRGTSRPLGNVANETLRLKRMETHRVFDGFWKRRGMTRSQGYRWLAAQLGLPKSLTHIGGFEMEQCQKVIDLCEKAEKEAA